MTVVLQVSDTHFGTEREVACAALRRLSQALRPDLLLVTGDITQRARRVEFEAARRFFDSLAIPASLVLPGNHDIPLFDLFSRVVRPYRRYSRAFGDALEGEFESDDLLVVGLNTTRRYRHKHGEVSAPQIERVAHRLAAAGPRRFRVVAVHQPVAVNNPGDASNLLRGHEPALRRWAQAGADAVLGGHIHLPYLLPLQVPGAVSDGSVWVVQAGTALSTRLRPGTANSVNVIRAGPGRHARVERWDLVEAADRFREMESTVIGTR